MMRFVLLITAVWGLWAMPVLCEGGIWTACCVQTCPENQDDDCGEQGCPDERDSDCDCPSCVELCNAQVTKPTGGAEVPGVSASNSAAILPPLNAGDAPGDQLALNDRSSVRLRCVHLPYPSSDRPLLL